MIASITLLINKSSYAEALSSTNYCPEKVTLKQTNTLEFIPGLPLPNIEVTGTNGEKLNNIAIPSNRNIEIPNQQRLEKRIETDVEIPQFSDNKEENNYYSQLFFWWQNDIDYQESNLTEKEKS